MNEIATSATTPRRNIVEAPASAKTPSAADGESGLREYYKAIREGVPYDVILLDLNMSGLSGESVLDHIRLYEKVNDIYDFVTVVVITGDDAPQRTMNLFKHGCQAYVVKPVSAEKLKNALTRDYTPGKN